MSKIDDGAVEYFFKISPDDYFRVAEVVGSLMALSTITDDPIISSRLVEKCEILREITMNAIAGSKE